MILNPIERFLQRVAHDRLGSETLEGIGDIECDNRFIFDNEDELLCKPTTHDIPTRYSTSVDAIALLERFAPTLSPLEKMRL
jgi:hypothetical protein